MITRISYETLDRMSGRFATLYGQEQADACIRRLVMLVGRYGVGLYGNTDYSYWDQADTVLITYADSLMKKDEPPLETLHRFLCDHLRGAVSTVHLLPFFPYSSDDGFSVIDYREVNPDCGNWDHVERIGRDFNLMFDLVLNHTSSQSAWMSDYALNIAPARNYFIEVEAGVDLSNVVRPRTSPLLTRFMTRRGEKHLWTTFSADQVDLNFANPDVLFEFLDILMCYIYHGARIIRLDAIAYLWKKPGSPCIHLKETHEVVKLFRDFLNMIAPSVRLLTETNVPHKENVSYFGGGDEAHMVYQFSLPPLILHALVKGSSTCLYKWARALSPPPDGCTYFNFTASHDGIGVRPLEGLVPKKEIEELAEHVKKRGGHVSRKTDRDGGESPYEFNIAYFDAMGGDALNEADHCKRFLCSQTLALAFRGIPGIYFHSLTATPNYHVGVQRTGQPRSINRKKWDDGELDSLMQNEKSATRIIFDEYVRRLNIRAGVPAFHPDAPQEILFVGDLCFCILRYTDKSNESLLALYNLTGKALSVDVGPHRDNPRFSDEGRDLLTGKTVLLNRHVPLESYQSMWLIMNRSG